MKCPEYLQGFEDWLLDHNRAEKTIRNATGDMVRVMKTRKIGSRGDLLLWLRDRRRDGALNVTMNHYIRSINLYCEFRGWEKFPYAPERKDLKVKLVSDEEREKIFASFSGYTGKRDRAIAALIFACGLRIGEVWNLTFSSLDGDILHVIGKGQKKRDVYFPPEARAALKDYLSVRLPTDPNYLFTVQNGRMKYDYIRQRVPRIAGKAGVKFNNHKARHTFATGLLRDGVSIYSVSKLLGHADVSTTAVYAHLDQSEAIEEEKRKSKRRFFLMEAEI